MKCKGKPENLWPSTLRTMCAGNVTAERILDVWARVHGRERAT